MRWGKIDIQIQLSRRYRVGWKFRKVTYATKAGGSVLQIFTKYHTKGDAALSVAVREETKAKGTGLFKAIEGYILAIPDY